MEAWRYKGQEIFLSDLCERGQKGREEISLLVF